MTGWRLWAVRVSHAGVAGFMLSRWAATGDDNFGVAAACFAFALAITFAPRRRRKR